MIASVYKWTIRNAGTDDHIDDAVSLKTGGDISDIVLWVAVMLAAGAVLNGTIVYIRRRKRIR